MHNLLNLKWLRHVKPLGSFICDLPSVLFSLAQKPRTVLTFAFGSDPAALLWFLYMFGLIQKQTRIVWDFSVFLDSTCTFKSYTLTDMLPRYFHSHVKHSMWEAVLMALLVIRLAKFESSWQPEDEKTNWDGQMAAVSGASVSLSSSRRQDSCSCCNDIKDNAVVSRLSQKFVFGPVVWSYPIHSPGNMNTCKYSMTIHSIFWHLKVETYQLPTTRGFQIVFLLAPVSQRQIAFSSPQSLTMNYGCSLLGCN